MLVSLMLIYSSSKTTALDVDNEQEYRDMVIKIQTERLKKVTILVDMLDVQASCLVQVRAVTMLISQILIMDVEG